MSPSSAPETVSKKSSPAALILPPVSTMKGTKLLWSPHFATLMSLYTAAARPGVWAVPIASRRGVPGHTADAVVAVGHPHPPASVVESVHTYVLEYVRTRVPLHVAARVVLQ